MVFEVRKPGKESAALRFLYHTAVGRLLLRPLVGRGFSRVVGRFMDGRASRVLIAPFVRKKGIDLSLYETAKYVSFNDFFTRRIRAELRPVDPSPDALVSPCDGWLSVRPIEADSVFPVKQSRYTLSALLGSAEDAALFSGGLCLVFRLCPEHYHRYCYPDSGRERMHRFLPGKLHTVRPIALERVPVFTENCREVTLLDTEHLGTVAQIEVGAMLVGRIANRHPEGGVRRGEEKGRFLYGGSTVVVLLQKDAAAPEPELLAASQRGDEVAVCMGQRIGKALRRL